jgi:hypothetical protein
MQKPDQPDNKCQGNRVMVGNAITCGSEPARDEGCKGEKSA